MSSEHLSKRIFLAAFAFMLLTTQAFNSNPDIASVADPSNPNLGEIIPIWDVDTLDNFNMQVVYNPEYNEYLAIWVTKQDEFSTDIWARRVAPDGTLYPQFNIYNVAGKQLDAVDAVYNPDRDEYYIVFEYPYSSTDTDLYSRTFSYDGANLGSVNPIDASLSDTTQPTVAYNSTDFEYLVTYTIKNPDGTLKLVASRIHPGNHVVLAGPVDITPAAANIYCHQADAAFNPSHNNYLIAYQKEMTSPAARVFIADRTASASLATISLEYQLSGEVEYCPVSIALGSDEYLAVWGGGPDDYITARRAGHDGTPLGPAGGFLISPTGGSPVFFRRDSRVGANFMGYWVVWETFDGTTADEGDIYGNFIPFGADQPAFVDFPVDLGVKLSG